MAHLGKETTAEDYHRHCISNACVSGNGVSPFATAFSPLCFYFRLLALYFEFLPSLEFLPSTDFKGN